MIKSVFSIDGIAFQASVLAGGIKRSASALDGKNAGRMMSGRMLRDLIGTYYNYSIAVATNKMDKAEYDRLYEIITAPVDSHIVIVPYGQTTMKFEAYISGAEDELAMMGAGSNIWGNLSFKFIAMEPQKTPT